MAIGQVHETAALVRGLRESSYLITVSLLKTPLAVVSEDKLVSRINS